MPPRLQAFITILYGYPRSFSCSGKSGGKGASGLDISWLAKHVAKQMVCLRHGTLVAPANLAVEYGLPRKWIVKAILAALPYYHPQDPQSVALAERLRQQGLSQVLQEICHIASDAPLAAEIESAWQQWKS